ncbi:MAG: calcineurin-like phosphoesterase C-terminal domain-containing protein [Alistipes sp.]|nr:calcineurin-like phosphoesterase C-terminal domain-containing protein [Alistipes sp.]
MKKIFSVILAGLMLIGCQNFEEQDVVGVDGRSLTVSLAETRTSLGAKEGVTYPVYWSEGDCIVINGIKSQTAQINVNNQASASFELGGVVEYPYSVTYPYCESTSAEQAIVVFPAKQSYVEGTFSSEAAPMCGYVKSGNSVALNHLATVLRLPIRASESGLELTKVVVTSISGAKIAGEFAVDCATATITPCEGAKNSITYSLPKKFTLSTDEDRVLYIALPAVDLGLCGIEFVMSNGDNMRANWQAGNVAAGVVREFKSITFKAGETCLLPAMGAMDDEFEVPYTVVSGYVRDTSGAGISGVAVSDGFSVVTTNAKGFYSMIVSPDTWYIFISLPSEYEVPTNEYGQPCFYKKYDPTQSNYNFELKPLAGGKETKFSLFVLTDTHVSTSYRRARFREETIASIKRHLNNEVPKDMPCYGFTLGDLVSNSSTNNTGAERVNVRDLLSKESVGFPVFQVMGNHDNTFWDANNPIYADSRNSTYNIKAQREHEDIFGPANYSFNRGDVHIIGMRNIIYMSNSVNNNYEVGFTDEQWEWLKQDLALVPRDKMVVLGCHIRLHGETKNHIGDVTALLGEYKEAHIFSGHSHVQRHHENSGSTKKVFEHNLAAVAGAGWYCKMCEDGCPIGYNVFVGEGATFSDWYFMSFNKGTDTRPQQMRLYRGNALTGIEKSLSNKPESSVTGYYKFNFSENTILANVYNADTKWVVKVYEDGVYSGNMDVLPSKGLAFSSLIGDGSAASPFRFADGVESGHDLYTAGLLLGIQSRYSNGEPAANCWQGNTHLYKYVQKNKNAQIRVVAIDRFGNEYTETKITEGTDYTYTSGDYKTDANLK